ncbi:unnamed protein product [Owenia fusiformis]|uniref:Uncharacterized protein n=1 Tax=Owenia fusiformis TaxID=6347 RepID=A0A8J1Y8Y2_OWEFU|nr:unnamed protein product [Owenia fusiformis]
MKVFDKTVPFKDQKYDQLKKDCRAKGDLFTDPVFKAEASSIYFSQEVPEDIEWKRPGEISEDPKLFVDGASPDDFDQGEVGNCWFIAACACIASDDSLWKKVVPDHKDQEFSSNYAGIFHFTFARFGVWQDVVIDDLLPTRNGKLIFVQSKSKNEFWSALLEKAYAKLFGSYEALSGGRARDALVDMTGGVGELVELEEWTENDKKKQELFDNLDEAMENNSLVSASIAAGAGEIEAKLDTGLVKGHAYSITAVRTLKLGKGFVAFFKSEKLLMIRCRNPWGEKEWNGPWSDGSEEWNQIGEGEKTKLDLSFGDNGEFWMSFDDFLKNFTRIDICHLINTSFFSMQETWKGDASIGEWKKPDRCGGCANNTESFLRNPQYLFEIKGKEKTVMISMEQEDTRDQKDKGAKNNTIGLAICKADLNREYRMHDVIEKVASCSYTDSRSVFQRCKLNTGRYLLVPSTFDPGFEGRFMLRMYSKKDPKVRELIEEEPPKKSGCCSKGPQMALQISIYKADGLEKQDAIGGADPYVKIRVGDEEYQTEYIENTRNPEWNERCTFYVKKLSDVVFEIWNWNIIKDELMGQARIMAASTKFQDDKPQTLTMLGKGDESKQYKPGRLLVQMKLTRDFLEV